MKDSKDRRNRVAAVVAMHHSGIAERAINQQGIVYAPQAMRMILGTVVDALAGETDPSKLGIDPLSVAALQLANLTEETAA